MKRQLILATTIAGFVSGPVAAMPHCGDRDTVIARLVGTYMERHFASGLQSETGLLEIWASEEGGTWTILMTRPDGQTCVMATGTHWRESPVGGDVAGEPA